MTVSIAFAAANSVILRFFKNRSFKTPGDVFFFNGGVSLLWTFILCLRCIFTGFEISPLVLLFGAIYALILFLFLHSKTEALSSGPVALTTLIGSAAFVVPTLYGVFIMNEKIDLLQIIGIILISFSLFLCINPKNTSEKPKTKWFLYCFLFFLVGGALGIFYKIFGASQVSSEVDSMMLAASAISAVFFFSFGYLLNRSRKCPPPKIYKSSLLFLISSAVAGCVYIRLNVSLSAVIPSAVFFPVSNGSLVLISTAAGYLFFKEKLKTVQTLGLLLGILAIAITGCSDILLGIFS